MKTSKLGDLATIRTGKLDVNAANENGEYPFFTCASKIYRINSYAFDSEAVLVAGNGDLNVKYYRGKFNAYQRTYVIESLNENEIDMKYLYYFMQRYIERLRRQSIGGIIKYIKLGYLTEAKIPLPSKEDQVRIALLLSRVEALIATRKYSLQQMDAFLKSTFLEMFGDPVKNEKEWPSKLFSDLLNDIQSGVSPKCEARKANEDEWGVLKLSAVTNCFFKENENKALPLGMLPQSKHEVKVGDLLFSRKNTYELVAACAYVFKTRPKLLMPDLIFRFLFKDDAKINPIYIWKLLISDSQRRKIQSYAAGAAGSMPNISKTNLRKVLLPIPPLELQNKFATVVEKVEVIKSRYQQNLTELENLYGALSQKVFKGDLDLSRVPLPELSETIVHERKLTDQIAVTDVIKVVEYPMSVPEERKNLLRNIFDEYLSHKKGKALSLDDFWQEASYKTIDMMDEFDKPWGVEDYEQVKDWLFGMIRDGSINQEFVSNAGSPPDGKIELRVKG